jgi:hypothetical protein
MKKKVRFENLKTGAKFKYKRCLYLKDGFGGAIRISDGMVDPLGCSEIQDETSVTPVKIKVEAK